MAKPKTEQHQSARPGNNPREANTGLSEGEVDMRRQWLELTEVDQTVLSELDALIGEHVDDMMEHLYSHFLKFEETRSFFPDEKVLNRARNAQAQYFKQLAKGKYGADYVSDRLRVGSTHYRIELDPKWYLGAYSRALIYIYKLIREKYEKEPAKRDNMTCTLIKLIFFDMGLAIDTYIAAKESAIRSHRDAIRELETERRVTKSIVESAPIGIVHVNNDFTCMECNEEFVQILSVKTREDIIGKRLFDLCPYLEKETFEEALRTGHSFRFHSDPLSLSRTEAEIGYWDWAVWPVKDGGSQGSLVAMFSSVTDRVRLQQQREDFVATLTHDLKTPILAANRALNLLMEGDFGPIGDSQRQLLETIHQSNDAMYRMVLTLLDVYRYDSGAKQLHLAPVNFSDTVSRIVNELKPLAAEKHITLDFVEPADPVLVMCDVEEVRRVIQNFIDNSLKYTAKGGRIEVAIEQQEQATVLKVSDTGRGISEEDKPKLFQRFWQAASGGRYYASTGLGLYLCRKIIELHGGKIWCESTLGKGSTFGFSLPASLSDTSA
ncbi:MAG TPA: protoglobin domain-containing protein [Candidatus Obscuribacterales bacterium]